MNQSLVAAVCGIASLLSAGVSIASAADDFAELWAEEWQFRLREFPMMAQSVGVHDYNDRLRDMSPAAIDRRLAYWKDVRARLQGIDASLLDDEGQINYQIFAGQLESSIADIETGAYLIPLNSDWGFHIGLARMPNGVPKATLQDYRNYLSRLGMIETLMTQYIGIMRTGMKSGMVLPKVVLEGRDVSITPHVVDDPEDSVFYGPFKDIPQSIPPEQAESLRAEARKIIAGQVVPAWRRFLTFFTEEYTPAGTVTIAATKLPDGAAYYQAQIREYTTLDMTADEIHAIGLSEVERIRSQMQAIIDELEFEGDFDAFLTFLRTDPQFYANSPRELLAEASYWAKKMDGLLPQIVSHFPRQPYGVEPVPADLAPFFTTGRYSSAPADSTRASMYWVNTHNLPSRTLYTLPALTLHEAVPGHHLQGALAEELENQPPFRRYNYISAFGEGWALYAEYLGEEVDFYETAYERFGRLTYEMWRACRLVVDTGMHAKDWSRQRAIDFMKTNTALSVHEITTEIDRYISWPAQALSYKLGELKIKELRARAQDRLGDRFDLRVFHDRVLSLGSVPLNVLESVIDDWIEQEAQSGA